MTRGNGSADAAELVAHDPECPCDGWEIVEGFSAPNQCSCLLIRRVDARARADERRRCIDIATAAAGKSPTLGQQRMLRALTEARTCQADGVDDYSTRSSHASDNADANRGETS